MPVPLMVAVVLAFGLKLPGDQRPLAESEALRRIGEVGLTVVVVSILSAIAGEWIARRIRRSGRVEPRDRRRFSLAVRGSDILGLASFAAILFVLDWNRVVDAGLGTRRVPVVEQLLRMAPYLLIDGLSAWGLKPAARLLNAGPGARSSLTIRARQALAVLMPVCLLDTLARHLLSASSAEDSFWPFVAMGAAAVSVFLLSPALVRLAWPMRPLPQGPLRDRLDRLSRRLKFRCTDILVWDTGHTAVNAGVTGALPWFRYVLLTDEMIEQLEPEEIEAVFGHEVGHVAHKHLQYFAVFFLASAAVLSLAADALERYVDLDQMVSRWIPVPTVAEVLKASVVIGGIGLYIYAVFGYLSRRFERQADLFGARAVSCQSGCPPHVDPNTTDASWTSPDRVCRMGIAIMSDALEDVTTLNGATPESKSWRHGTVAQRLSFLEGLEHDANAERRFQARVSRLRWGLLLSLAVLAGASELLRVWP